MTPAWEQEPIRGQCHPAIPWPWSRHKMALSHSLPLLKICKYPGNHALITIPHRALGTRILQFRDSELRPEVTQIQHAGLGPKHGPLARNVVWSDLSCPFTSKTEAATPSCTYFLHVDRGNGLHSWWG